MKKNRNQTKSRIVSSAWNLFYKQGYDDTTIDDIVSDSCTSKGSFYHYFDSKESLLGSLAYLFDEKYESLSEKINYDDNTFDILIYLNQELFEMIDNTIEPQLLSKLYSTQLNSHGEKSLLDNDRYYYKLLKRLILNGQEKGEITKSMTVNDIVRLYAMCERAIIYEWCLSGFTFSLKSYALDILPKMISKIKSE